MDISGQRGRAPKRDPIAARLSAIDAPRTNRAAEYRRFLRRVGLGALIPGLGLISAGRKWLGGLILAVFVLGVGAAAVYVVYVGKSGLVRVGSDPDRLGMIGVGALGIGVVWLVTAVVGFYLLQPAGLRAGQRLFSALVVVVAGSLVVAPLTLGSQYAFTQRDLINSVFADEDDQHSLTIPKEVTDEDPWAGQDRVNVLVLGSDGSPYRDGVRTDTIMVASIDTRTGDTALFSLPRNLQYTPMPEGPLREAYPDGYHGVPESEYWLSSMYRNVPAEFPDYFKGIENKGAEAMKLVVGEALGLDISYYVMVNLRGFQYLVDALGGIELDVPYPIPIGTQTLPNGTCSEESGWIEEGDNQVLDGYHALWFARARCGPGPVFSDYERMRRQRCVIGAIAEQADPFSLLTRYQQLAEVAKDTMATDIGRRRLADFAELALKVQDAGIRSLPFTDTIVEYYDPDYELIRQFVRQSLEPAKPADSPDSPAGTDDPAEPGGEAESDKSPSAPATGNATPGDDTTDEPDADQNTGEPETDEITGEPGGEETPGEEASPDESGGAQEIGEVC